MSFFHASAIVGGPHPPKNRSPEYYLLKTTRKCPLCGKKFKARKFMLQHLFDPLGRHYFEELPKEIAVPLSAEASKLLGPKKY